MLVIGKKVQQGNIQLIYIHVVW